MSGRLAGKVAIVSGGASGLGEACGRLFAAEGASVVLADLDLERAENVARELGAAGRTAEAALLDVTSEASWDALCHHVLARFGRLNVLVNSAGISVGRVAPSEASLADWQRLMSINLDGVFLGTKHALAAMRASAPVCGSIVNVSSILGIVGQADLGAYCASKGGVRLYTKSVALSCAREGVPIRANSIHPGFADTPLLRGAIERFADRDAAYADYARLAPMGRLGTPADIAYGALYLASDEASFVSGTELVIDGGYTAA